MNKRKLGILLALISAFAFGVSPVFSAISIREGSNGVMTMLLRNVLVLPILIVIIRIYRLKIKVNKVQLKQLIILNVFGGALTGCLLFTSYEYTGIGLATSLHFIYPVLIMISCLIIFKEKANLLKILALISSIIGIFLTVDINNFSFIGFTFAIVSGVTYAFYILFLDKTGLKSKNVVVITFYSCLINSIVISIFAILSNKFTLDITPIGYASSFIVAILSTLVGVAFFQVALQFIDSSTASIMCTAEPLTSVIMGIIVLSEPMSVIKSIGCILIILAVFIISIDNKRGNISNINN